MPNVDNIYTFKNVTLTTTSSNGVTEGWCVSAIQLQLQENGIPTLVIRIDPIHFPADPSSATPVSNLAQISEWNDYIQTLAKDKAKAKVTFEVWKKQANSSDFTVEQKIELQNWIVASSGITSGTRDGFMFEMTIQHPIARASFIGTSVANIVTNIEGKIGEIGSDNIIVALVETLKAYSDVQFTTAYLETNCVQEGGAPEEGGAGGAGGGASEGSGTTSAEELVAKFREDMLALAEVLEFQLEWKPDYYSLDYSDWPFIDSLFPDAAPKYAYIVSQAIWGVKDSDMWGFLANNLFPQWNMTIIPTFWTKLKLVPTTPWAKPKHTIKDTDIARFDFPGYERNMISGVICMTQHAGLGVGSSFFKGKDGDEEQMTDGIIYRPDKQLDGSLIDMQVPDWLLALQNFDGAVAGENSALTADTNNTETPGNTSVAETPAVNAGDEYAYYPALYRCATYHCAHQLFLSSFRSGTQGSATLRVSVKYDGQFILPGEVVEFVSMDQSNGHKTVILEAYVVQAIHDIDFQRGTASTQLAFKYVRPSGGFPEIINVPQLNPLYDGNIGVPA